MDENNNYSVEPMEEPQAQPTYSPYAAREQEPKKKHTAVKMTALILVVALVASIGGSLLTTAIGSITGRREEETPEPAEVAAAEEETPAFERVEHELPARLNTNDTGKSLTTVQVYELTVNSVVGSNTEITTNAFGQEAVAASSGSGFILSEDGYIITNAHVVDGATTIEVALFNGDCFPAELVAADSSYDIAVLKIEGKGMPAVSVGDSDTLKVGEEVVAIGNPLGELTFTMTNGILSALDREINIDGNPQSMLQTNAAINSGNSGGPLFDMDGNVIGVTSAKYSGSTMTGTSIEGLGFAIPINDALKVAYDLVEYGFVKGQAYLGVTVRTLDSDTAAYYSLPVGPRVEALVTGSCADKAGVQVGDIIIKVDGEDVENNAGLQSMMKKRKAGETITLTVFRMGAELELTVTLDEKPSQEVLDAQIAEYEQQQEQESQEEYYYQFPEGFGFGG